MLLNKIKNNEFIRNIGILTFGTLIAQLISIIVVPILSRLYTPEDYGLLAIYTAVISICAISFTLRYETSILIPKCDSEAAALVRLTVIIVGIFLLITSILGLVAPVELKERIGVDKLGNLLYLAFFTAGVTSLFTTFQNWQNRTKSYVNMTAVRIVQSVVGAVTGLILGYLSIEGGLLIMQTLSALLAMLLSWFYARKFMRSWKEHELKSVAKKHKKAPIYLLPASFLDIVSTQLPVLLIALWFSESLTGNFSMAWRLLMLPMVLVGGAIAQVFIQKFSVAISNPKDAKRLLVRTWLALAVCGILPLFILLGFSEELFVFVLGERWVESGRMAAILAPMIFIMLISSPTSGSYLILELHKYSLYLNVAAIVYRPLSLYVGYYFSDLYMGLTVWVVCEIMQNIVYQFIAYFFLNKRIVVT